MNPMITITATGVWISGMMIPFAHFFPRRFIRLLDFRCTYLHPYVIHMLTTNTTVVLE
jgi:hypothetical protein